MEEKLPKEELSADDLIPDQIEGAPTDVVECKNFWPSKESNEELAALAQAKSPN